MKYPTAIAPGARDHTGIGKMDFRLKATLETYHERMREEHAALRLSPQSDGDGGQDQRMRAIGPETGQLLNILARSIESPTILELGTSFGYSGIWLGEAARASGGRLITMERHAYKSDYARDMAEKSGVSDVIDFRVGDAVSMIAEIKGGFDFVFVDLWKDLYVACLEAFYPKLNPGAIIVADNIIMPGNAEVMAYVRAIRAKPGITSVLLPVGSGLEVSRYTPA